MIIARELVPLCRYIRVTISKVLGGEPEEWHSDTELDSFIASVSIDIVNRTHDLIVMLDYFYALIIVNAPLESEEREILDVAESLIREVRRTNIPNQ
ncbi:hypothetical protein [Vibrio splendidus]|uniref:hypothetical protein n=1 Tax=Vibrio splendidus TaxID=29497 RepID=UPI0006CA1B6B|nr:hypothetical protein [Vibrio splendidus]KPL96996.1 hypothetical protein AN167_24955 [Vibrio splendidus]